MEDLKVVLCWINISYGLGSCHFLSESKSNVWNCASSSLTASLPIVVKTAQLGKNMARGSGSPGENNNGSGSMEGSPQRCSIDAPSKEAMLLNKRGETLRTAWA